MEKEILDVKPGKVEDAYGLAVDVGTTTVAAYLCNLRSGEVIATESMMNPQISYGEDMMSVSPFPPVVHQSIDVKARDLGLELLMRLQNYIEMGLLTKVGVLTKTYNPPG
jgi:uncharacterized 2Fe-2S/4Fe-4S cluster protein (DUF4445 family)